MARTHPPSQEYGASIPRSKPNDHSFPSIAQDTPERHQMAAALDETANIKLGKAEKERQLKHGTASAGQILSHIAIIFTPLLTAT